MNLPETNILIHQFMQTMRMRNCSECTINAWQFVLKRFTTWCEDRGLECMSEISPDHLAAYRRSLFHYRNPKTGCSTEVRHPSALPDSDSPLVRVDDGAAVH